MWTYHNFIKKLLNFISYAKIDKLSFKKNFFSNSHMRPLTAKHSLNQSRPDKWNQEARQQIVMSQCNLTISCPENCCTPVYTAQQDSMRVIEVSSDSFWRLLVRSHNWVWGFSNFAVSKKLVSTLFKALGLQMRMLQTDQSTVKSTFWKSYMRF